MKKRRWLLRVGAALLVAVLVATAVLWDTICVLFGVEDRSAQQASIPECSAQLQPPEAGTADWPCWRGARNDGRSRVAGIRKDWSSGLTKLWEVSYLCQGRTAGTWSAPVIQGNRLVVPGRDKGRDLVFCLDPKDGTLLWLGSYEAPAKTGHGPGARATPSIDGDRVYTFGRSGDLACWRLHDGEEVWRVNVRDAGGDEPKWGFSSSPLILGHLVLVQAGGTARTIAYDKMTGEVVWKTGKGPAGYASFATMTLGERIQLLAFHGTGLAGLDPKDGGELWNVPWKTSYDVNATTPVVEADSVLITSAYGTGCALIKIADSGPQVVWQNQTIASHHSDPHVIEGYVYTYSGSSHQNRGALKCVDLATGEEQWSTGEVGWGTATYVDGHLLCMDIKGNLFLVKPDPSEFKKVAELRNGLGDTRGPTWTIPVVANGRLYLRFRQTLVCYDLGSS
ncbi:PQQ-binding-like beta-propeller repeat protein [Planctomycetota bacterium]